MAVRLMTILVFAVSVIVITMVIYLAVYKRKINRRLEEPVGEPGEGRRRPMLPPLLVFMFTLIGVGIAAFLAVVVAAAVLYGAQTQSRIDEHDPVMHQVWMDREYIENSPLKGYEPGDEIPGYTKHEAADGDIRFVYYVFNDYFGGIFPQLLITAEYTGEGSIVSEGEVIVLTGGRSETSFSTYGNSCGETVLRGFDTEWVEDEFVYTYFVSEERETQDTTELEDVMAHSKASGTLTIDMSDLEALAQPENSEE